MGNSTNLSILHRLGRRPLAAVNISPPALFRVVEKFSPTLLIDEGDRFLKGDEENIGLLDSGHYRPLANVLRCVGEKMEVRQFTTWCPKAVGAIGALPGTLQDRSIIISMQSKSAEEQVERLCADREDEAFSTLRRKLARWAADNAETLKDIDVDAPRELDDRSADNWRVLLAVAHVAGGDWPWKVREAAVALTADREEQDIGTQLLVDLIFIFGKEECDFLPTADKDRSEHVRFGRRVWLRTLCGMGLFFVLSRQLLDSYSPDGLIAGAAFRVAKISGSRLY